MNKMILGFIAFLGSLIAFRQVTMKDEEQAPETAITGYKIIVYNNDVNTFEDVALILHKALKISPDSARIFTWEVDARGQVDVYWGDQEEECIAIANQISSIGLQTSVERF